MVTVKQEGRRYYLEGLPFGGKDAARDAGCKFDWDRKLWWSGKEFVALEVARMANSDPKPASEKEEEAIPPDARVIAGRAEYKGKSYYLLVHSPRKDGAGWATRLCARDGKFSFWVPKDQSVTVLSKYGEKKSIQSLRNYADRKRRESADEEWEDL